MSQLPPHVPTQLLNYAPPARGKDLRTIALRQRAIMFCILGEITAMVLLAVLPLDLKIIGQLLYLAGAMTAAVFIFMLSIALYNTGAGIVLGILTLIPLLGLIVLLIVNGKATTTLRAHGIKVGLMGADIRQIPSAGQTPRY